MLSEISAETNNRFRELSEFLRATDALADLQSPMYSGPKVTLKGLFFVHLYGIYEYTIVSGVQKVLEIIDSRGHPINSYKPMMLSLVLDSCCESMSSVGRNKSWEKRWDLFGHIENNDVVEISNTLMPTDGKNFRVLQLNSIWKTLCISQPTLPNPMLNTIIEELVEHRNAIAHGRETPSAIGGRHTVPDLERKKDMLDDYCLYFIDSLDNYLTTMEYLA